MRIDDFRRSENVEDDREASARQEMQGYVVPDSFAHGTAEQRKHWRDRSNERLGLRL